MPVSMKTEFSHRFKSTFRALRNRNYRLFFVGQGVSLTGMWMQQVAMSWLVYRLTNSAFLLGLVGFSLQIPSFILAPFTGVIADRHNRRNLLIMTQILAMAQALIVAALVLTGAIRFWHILSLSIFLGLVNSLDLPARQSFVIDMVDDKEDLGNAIALNSSIFNGARLIGPSIAGILIAATGEGVCFLINGMSFLVVIAALLAMKIAHCEKVGHDAHILHDLKEGLSYAIDSVSIRAILLLLGLTSLMGMQYVVLMPIFADNILHGGPHALGFLMGASGTGALLGSLYLASRKTVLGLARIIGLSPALLGASLIAFSLSRSLTLSLLLMFVSGFAIIAQLASSNTVIQTVVDDDKRGRVMSLFVMAFVGTMPFGSLVAGCLASKISATHTLLIAGMCCILGSILFTRNLAAIKKSTRPIYVRKGIISEVAPSIDQ
jgi:MFS family permease